MSHNWYYTKDGKQQFGPFSDSVFSSLAMEGSLDPKDYVRTDSMQRWVLAENIKGLSFGPLPEISIPIIEPSVKPAKANCNSLETNVDASLVSNEINETTKPFQIKDSLENKSKPSPEFKNTSSGPGSTMLAAGAGAAIGLGVGAILANSMSSGSRRAINPVDFSGLSQRLKTLNIQGLLSDFDFQSILQLINNQSVGLNDHLLPNQSKKNSPVNSKKITGGQSSEKNLVDSDDSQSGDSFTNGEIDSDFETETEDPGIDVQYENEIFDAEEVSSSMDDNEEIFEAETFEDENVAEDLEDEDFEDEDFEDDDLGDDDLGDDDLGDDDLGDDDLGDDDYSTYDSGGDYSGDDD